MIAEQTDEGRMHMRKGMTEKTDSWLELIGSSKEKCQFGKQKSLCEVVEVHGRSKESCKDGNYGKI